MAEHKAGEQVVGGDNAMVATDRGKSARPQEGPANGR